MDFCDYRRPFFGSLAARLASDLRYRRSQIFQALLPFFPFFACFLIFLKQAFSGRKIALEKFPKKDKGTHGSWPINEVRDFWDRRSSKEGNLHLFNHRLKMPLPLLSCTSLLSSRSSDGEDCLSLLENIPRGDLAISKTYPSWTRAFFFCQPCWVRKPIFFLFVKLFRSDCQIANEGTLFPQN